MTEPKTNADKAAGKLSKTTENYLKEIYREWKYKRRNEFTSKYTDKGLQMEESGITLYSRITKTFYKKNDERLNNKFITGEPDFHDGETITTCKKGTDIKCSWSLFTFPYHDEEIEDSHFWQNHGYTYLTGAEQWGTAYCLVNTPGSIILQEKKSMWYAMGCPELIESENGIDSFENRNYKEYIIKCQEIEKNMIFNLSEFKKEEPNFDLDITDWKYDIPLKERMIEYEVLRDEDAISRIETQVMKARKWLNEFQEKDLNRFLKQTV